MFQFKFFSVEDNNSTMKVGTDAILLACWANVMNRKNILEIGCGCGLISLILAQRQKGAMITAIDIHKPSVEECVINFQSSSWSERLDVAHISLQEFAIKEHRKYDLIVSNPPFFNNSLKSLKKSKSMARHTHELSFSDLAFYASKLLQEKGTFCCILPCKEAEFFKDIALQEGLFCRHCISVFTKSGNQAKRYLMEFSKNKCECEASDFFIRDQNGNYTNNYLSLVREFYLFA